MVEVKFTPSKLTFIIVPHKTVLCVAMAHILFPASEMLILRGLKSENSAPLSYHPLTRAHPRKRPALLVMTTFSNFRGGRLQEL